MDLIWLTKYSRYESPPFMLYDYYVRVEMQGKASNKGMATDCNTNLMHCTEKISNEAQQSQIAI